MTPGDSRPLLPVSRTEILMLLLLAVAYAVPVITFWNPGYLDFGDGNYMYISWRLSQGAVLYRDILAPQPPLHLYVGAAIAWIGEWLFSHPIWAFRTFSLILHIATMVLVWLAARLIFRPGRRTDRRAVPVVAAAIYLLQPVGFWWTLGYQSQPLLIFLLLIMFCCVVANRRGVAWLGGLAGGLALLTNMTTVPYVAFTMGWMLWRRFRHGLIFSASAILPPLLVIPAMELYTGAYISNVFQNQAGAFPRAEVLAQAGETIPGYVLRKLTTEGGDVLRLEGTWIALAAIGMLGFGALRKPRRTSEPEARAIRQRREYALYYSFFSLCCILYVAKGGTVDYVFSVAEPYVAIFAAPVVVAAAIFARRLWGSGPRLNDLTPLSSVLISIALALAVMFPGIRFIQLTLTQATYELAAPETLRIVGMIKQRTSPDDLIIAPPHFAFLAQRKIVADYSEHFLWRIKYMNERLDGIDGQAVHTVRHIASVLDEQELPFLVMDMNQTGALPEIEQALQQHYQPLMDTPLQMLNTPLQFYVPKNQR